jgi:malonyl-ACP O-methyltransferase BioC
MTTIIPSRKHIASAFSKGALTYDNNASIQREILLKLSSKLPRKNLRGPWVDLGSGTGMLERGLSAPWKKVPIACLDLANGPLKLLQSHSGGPAVMPVQADIDRLPFKTGAFSLAFMSSVIQWLPSPAQSLFAINGALSPGGKLYFSAFCEGTFNEFFTLRTEKGLPVPIGLQSKTVILSMLENSGFKTVRLEAYEKKVYFYSAWDVLKNLSSLGASAVMGPRLSRKELFLFCEDYEDRFKTLLGVPVSYSIALCVASKERLP